MTIITSRSNEQVKMLQKLRQKKNRDQEHLVPIEGKKLLTEAMKNDVTIKAIYISEAFDDNEFVATLKKQRPQVAINYLSEFVFAAVSTMKTPEGVIAIIKKPTKKKFMLIRNILS